MCAHVCVFLCVSVFLSLCICKNMCETAEVRGGKGRQAISALYLCQQSQTDMLTPDDDDEDDEDEDDDDEDDDQCYLLVSTIANRHYVLLPPHLSPKIYGGSCLGSTVSLSVCTTGSNGEVVGSIFQIKSHKVFKSLPCLV